LAHPHWINVDGYANTNVHFCLDFTRRLPFPACSFDGIFCEHVLEHFTLQEGLALLRECWRILRPSQGVRIVVPDAEKIMKTYFESPFDLIAQRPVHNSCAMETVNFYFRQVYDHQYAYDWELLRRQLEIAGFTNITRLSFGRASVYPSIVLDDKAYEWESLYVEAVKPPPVGLCSLGKLR
jgi:predicted SAM-dependent methyltransferase